MCSFSTKAVTGVALLAPFVLMEQTVVTDFQKGEGGPLM